MKIPILRGRDLTDRDNLAGTLVAIINQSMAKRYWPNEDPIGKHITFDLVPDERPREIVAIVGAIGRVARIEGRGDPEISTAALQALAKSQASSAAHCAR